MGVTVDVTSAAASPSAIQAGGTTAISVTVFSDAAPTNARARYVLGDNVPFTFGNNGKETRSALVLVGPAGTEIATDVNLTATGAQRGFVTIRILVSERDGADNPVGGEQRTSVIVDVQG